MIDFYTQFFTKATSTLPMHYLLQEKLPLSGSNSD